MSHRGLLLGVNVDHIATLREARGTTYPDPMQAADIARKAGADSITVHLREDRRHIQDHDVFSIKGNVALPLNLEMAATEEMLKIASVVKPEEVCLVPEKRQELTTEGGLDVARQLAELKGYVDELRSCGAKISLFIDPEVDQIEAANAAGADIVELHTGVYAECPVADRDTELQRLQSASHLAARLDLQVNAGHGLHYQNVQAIACIPEIECLNIGHAIVARASMTGFHEAVFSMKQLMIKARLSGDAQDNNPN